MIILPRRALDKHTENSKVDVFFVGGDNQARSQGLKKTPFFAPFYEETIILPRHARDKHSETSKRDVRFLIGEQPDTVAAGCQRRRRWRREAAAAGW